MREENRRVAFSRSRSKVPTDGANRFFGPGLFYTMFAALVSTNILTMVGFLMSPDIARLVSGQNERVFVAYEDRIAQLRIEVDRLHSRQYAQAGNLNLQLQELSHQQAILSEQHNYVKLLANKAQELGIQAPILNRSEIVPDAIVTGSIGVSGTSNLSQVEIASRKVVRMMEESRLALGALSQAANTSTGEILSELNRVGISLDLQPSVEDAIGGPFLPASENGEPLSLVDDANAVAKAFERFKAARSAITQAPIHMPVSRKVRISSNFGPRSDPFLKRKAFHSGIDFAAPRGTQVVSAGAGTVVFAGQKSGYGKTVEIEHGDGLTTRYAHLSEFIVKKGQIVGAGTPIAKVGSTGRSTGPHLHFEVRKIDKPLNPSQFLNAGNRLARFL